jgi:uncharacterized protein YjaZ
MENINDILIKAEKTVLEYVPQVKNLNIQLVSDREQVIPEIGIGGNYSKAENRITIFIDPEHKNILENISKEILKTLAHEYMHASREQKIPWEECTLLEALVTEGLAQCFEVEVCGEDPIYARTLSAYEIQHILKQVTSILNTNDFDYSGIFFGVGGIYKKWTGYSVGYWLVNEYLRKTHKKASQLILEDSKTFLLSLKED